MNFSITKQCKTRAHTFTGCAGTDLIHSFAAPFFSLYIVPGVSIYKKCIILTQQYVILWDLDLKHFALEESKLQIPVVARLANNLERVAMHIQCNNNEKSFRYDCIRNKILFVL